MPSETIETDSHTLVTIACLSDNYAFLLQDKATGKVALIDVPEAAPIASELSARGWTLSQIWLTHHHPDHIQGVAELTEQYPAPLYGAAADAHRLPNLDTALIDGDTFALGETPVHVIDVSGHTLGHIALYTPTAKAAFTADSLMALGCGRLFEGTPAQMYESLAKMANWPDDTLICSGHEYTASNAKFALTVDPDNMALRTRARDIDKARAADRFTVPSLMSLERATNPFLRAKNSDHFAEIRAQKDRF
ncbi:hydroxyacylglutathione hydrolase [uncultured Sulfitobacter sp.]|uniref:hydroxyacylglutathione hydrolase n=1 Tax=uncultured Sulfitobacter sp. TaxID=191468 RepID=UPI0026322248|nr:hydroxyacylglutathione hydrolase [uncultured Sulfitobacter sp.]